MAGRQGFITNHLTYVYQNAPDNASAAFGVDTNDLDKWKLCVKTDDSAYLFSKSHFTADPAANGDITFLPNGTGAVVLSSVSDDTLSRDLKFDKMRTTGTNIVTGDTMGQIKFRGYAPTSGYVTAASITSTSSGTILNNRVAGNLVFATHPDSASGLTPTTRMTIGPEGDITIAKPTGTEVALTITDGGFTVSAGSTTLTPLAAARAGIVKASTAGVLSALIDSNTDGQVLISSSVGVPAWASITAGTGISVTPGAGSITIAATSTGIAWSRETTTPIALVANHGYVQANAGAGLTTFTLPATAALGTEIRIVGESSGGWTMTQGAGQSIQYGNVATTIGVGGSLSSSNRYDCVNIVCRVADTTWSVTSSIGVLNVV